jgi:hypothetical protein
VNQSVTVNNPQICYGYSAVLIADTTASHVIWSTGETNRSITVYPLSNTVYTVTASSGNCSSTTNATVTVKFCVTNPGCRSYGFWKNHPELWPVDSLVIGGVVYPANVVNALLAEATDKDMSTALLKQLVAAKLNVLIGNEPSCIIPTLLAADAWLASYPPFSGISANKPAWKSGEPLKNYLERYDAGKLCAP